MMMAKGSMAVPEEEALIDKLLRSTVLRAEEIDMLSDPAQR